MDASGVNPYKELNELAFNVLSLPHSNAEVERLFSQLNIVKSKLRNRLKTDTVNAILAVKGGLRRVGKCCYSYELPRSVVKLIGTMAVYSSEDHSPAIASSSTSGENLEDDDELDFFCFLEN